MIFEKIMLDDEAYLEVYAADKVGDFVRNAILVIPGGGYGCVCADREGEPIALAFIPYGYNAFVLHYSVGGKRTFPTQLIQASMAMKYIKDNAEKYNINPDRVFVTGFSAGGHLAGSLGTMWHKQEIYDAIDMPYGYNKPAGMMLIYPVITGLYDWAHQGSFVNLLGTQEPSEEQLRATSLEENVDARSVPLYLVHTSNDQVVNIRHALYMANAYTEAGLTFEMHVYPDAPHGVALGNAITKCGCEKYDNPAIAKWVENAVEWAKSV